MKKLPLMLALTASAAVAQQQKPNVIIIYADDLGYGDLGCYGAKGVETPAVDRLASEGTRFTQTHAAAATSTPSRYSMLTGCYAWRTPGTDVAPGDEAMIIKPTQFTIADAFKSAGYTTGAFGKWHLGLGDKSGEQDWNAQLAAHPGDLGFDKSYIQAATADRVPCVFIEDGQVANFDPENPIQVSYKHNFEGEPTGKNNPELLYNLKPSQGHDQSIVNGISRIGYMKGGGKALWKDENIADSITAHAISFIKSHADEPFFIYLATNDIHVPRFPHQRHLGKSSMGLRGDAIVQFDWTVGQVLNTLDSLGLTNNTLVILSSDNGPVLDDGYQDRAVELVGEHSPTGGLRGGKYSAFEGGTRVPMIVRWPAGNVPAGAVNNKLNSQIDWLASLGSLVGARIPRNAASDSRSYMLPELLNHPGAPARPYVIEFAYDHTLGIRTDGWKYVRPGIAPPKVPWGTEIETGVLRQPQLFKMNDSGELKNVIDQYPEKAAELSTLLDIEEAGK